MGSGPLVSRLWIPGPDGLRRIEGRAKEIYGAALARGGLLDQLYVWRVTVTVPGYGLRVTLRIEVREFSVEVIAEDWPGSMKHTFGRNRLCMWFPSDPPQRQWRQEDGLVKLIDTAVMHLFKELHFAEKGVWLGEEAPHDAPKIAGGTAPPAGHLGIATPATGRTVSSGAAAPSHAGGGY